jgi:hypothetical protein
LSYAHQDKRLARQVKEELEQYGFDCFLAHEDIAPSVEWQDEIVGRLRSCSVFIALLTEAFDESDWTHQEIGIAYSRNPIMVPIGIDRKPVGFLAKYQAITLSPEHIKEACFKIVRSVAAQDNRLAREIRRALIKRLGEAQSYDEAGFIAIKLRDMDALTADEMNTLLKLASSNPEVYESRRASAPIRALINRYKQSIRKGVLKKFYEVWAYK